LPLTAGNATFETLEVTLLGGIVVHNQTGHVPVTTKAQKTTPKPETMTLKATDKSLISEAPIRPTKNEKIKTIENTPKDTSTDIEEKKNITPPVAKISPINKAVKAPTGSWEEVLAQLKTHHNTLYSVLRMAQVSTNDGTLTLTIRFEFHKKQFAHGKNMKTLQDIITSVYGSPQTIQMNVETTKQQPTALTPNEDKDLPLTNISNIFGGAELLD